MTGASGQGGGGLNEVESREGMYLGLLLILLCETVTVTGESQPQYIVSSAQLKTLKGHSASGKIIFSNSHVNKTQNYFGNQIIF